jgi:hypothetical protein
VAVQLLVLVDAGQQALQGFAERSAVGLGGQVFAHSHAHGQQNGLGGQGLGPGHHHAPGNVAPEPGEQIVHARFVGIELHQEHLGLKLHCLAFEFLGHRLHPQQVAQGGGGDHLAQALRALLAQVIGQNLRIVARHGVSPMG